MNGDDEGMFITRVKSLRECVMLQLWSIPNYLTVIERSPVILSLLDNLEQIITFHDLVVRKHCENPLMWIAFSRLLVLHAQFRVNLRIASTALPSNLVEVSCFFDENQWDFMNQRIEYYVESIKTSHIFAESGCGRRALELINESLHEVDTIIERYEEINEILMLEDRMVQSRVRGKACPNLVSGGRHLIQHGELLKINKFGNKVPYYFILFNDSLFMAKIEKPGNPDSPLMFKSIFELKECNVEENHGTIYSNASFLFKSPQKSFAALFHSKEFKDESFYNFKSVIAVCEEKREAMIRAPIWVPNSSSNSCFVCHDKFSIILRKHHCRFWYALFSMRYMLLNRIDLVEILYVENALALKESLLVDLEEFVIPAFIIILESKKILEENRSVYLQIILLAEEVN